MKSIFPLIHPLLRYVWSVSIVNYNNGSCHSKETTVKFIVPCEFINYFEGSRYLILNFR